MGTGAIQTSVIGEEIVPAMLCENLGQPCHGRDTEAAVSLKIDIGEESLPTPSWGSVELNTLHWGGSSCGPNQVLELESHLPLALTRVPF